MQYWNCFKARAFFIAELWSNIQITSILADICWGEVDIVSCAADDSAWSIHIWYMQVVLLKSRWKARYGNKHLFMGLTNNSHLIVTASLKTIDVANWQLVRRDWLEKKAV